MKRLIALLPLLVLPSACLNLGTDRLRPEPAAYQLQACSKDEPLERSSQDIGWELKYLGPSAPLATARAPWGAALRYVVPYTLNTSLYELKITNRSKQVLWVDPAKISLQLDGQPVSPLGMEFFASAWPSGAVTSDAEMIDRSMAISEVTRTLFVKRPLEPGESYTGVLPFLRSTSNPDKLKITGFERGDAKLGADFCLKWKPAA